MMDYAELCRHLEAATRRRVLEDAQRYLAWLDAIERREEFTIPGWDLAPEFIELEILH